MSSRRTFLVGAGAAVLAPASLSGSSAPDQPAVDQGEYVVGLVADPGRSALDEAPLKVYVSATADGAGFGLLADRLDPSRNSHLEVRERARHGGHYRWEGVVVRSNTPDLVGQPFVLTADVHGDAVPELELSLAGQTLGGSGVITRS